MIRITILGIALAVGLLTTPASGAFIMAQGVYTTQLDADGVDYDYTITLTNTAASTDVIGTFWFSWVPGKDFMTNRPISEVSPTGWNVLVTHGGATDGYAIQWVASAPAYDLAVGNSLNFSFVSAETPAELAGNSQLYPTFAEGTSFVYNGVPFSADSERLDVTPEPSSLVLSVVGIIGVFACKRRRGQESLSVGG